MFTMRKLLFICLGLAFMVTVQAQNSQGKSDDAARLSLGVDVDAADMPIVAQAELRSRIIKICVLNGVGTESANSMFSIKATVDLTGKELTPTAPPMHSLNLTVNMYLIDNATGNIFSQTSVDLKGAGQNESKAYNAAIKSLNPKKGQFKTFVEQGKAKILEFYNSQCDLVISRAQALQSQGKNDEANAILMSVPEVCKDCYEKCMQLANGRSTEMETIEADVSVGDSVKVEIPYTK